MPTITSRVPPLLDYLVTLFQAAATIGLATPPVTVFDGPQTTGLDPPLALWVGLPDPDNTAAETAADFTQTWAAMGRLGRDEIITIHCCAQAWSGVDDIKTVRLAVTGITSAVEVLMQADVTQFGGNVLYPAPGFASGSLTQNNTPDGVIARIPFDLTFKSRIG